MVVPDKNYDRWANISGSVLDPYFVYISLKPWGKMIKGILFDPEYTKWNLYGDFRGGCQSADEALAPRDEGITYTRNDPRVDGNLIHDKTYFPDFTLEKKMFRPLL